MGKTLTFNNGTEEITLSITMLNKGISGGTKEALIFNVSKSDHTEEEIRSLLDNTGDITYMVDEEVKETFEGYALLPERNLDIVELEEIYIVTLIQRGDSELALMDAQDAIGELMEIVADLSMQLAELSGKE